MVKHNHIPAVLEQDCLQCLAGSNLCLLYELILCQHSKGEHREGNTDISNRDNSGNEYEGTDEAK
jgi:hypothetical protein